MLKIPIVIAAYNRLEPLTRLLQSLAKAVYPLDVKLIISIDGGGGNQTIIDTANRFEWKHGEKQVIVHDVNLGLRKHILKCGELTKYYDGIVLLEDDLYVSPYFYTYALQAQNAYRNEQSIAGIALYSHQYNETATLPFRPLDDGYDVYFMQLACSWGQSWLAHQWAGFESWYNLNSKLDLIGDSVVPPDVRLWPESSWKKYFLKYILEKDKYFVYPKISLTTNFADPGVNHLGTNIHQVPLLYRDKEYIFPELCKSIAKYDCYCEIDPASLSGLNNELAGIDFEVDLYGMKNINDISSEYVITTQTVKKSVSSFGRKLKPHELNVIENIEGNEIRLSLTRDMADYGVFVRYRNHVNQSYDRTHAYFYQITKDHYKPTLPQKNVSFIKRLYNKVRRVF